MMPRAARAVLASCAVILGLCVAINGRKLAQDIATFQGNTTGLYTLEDHTCYVAAIPLGNTSCSDPTCCWSACNDIWETDQCEYYCYCIAADGCSVGGGDGTILPAGTCVLSTNFNGTAEARRRRRLAQSSAIADEFANYTELGSIQSVQVTTGATLPTVAGYRLELAALEPSLASGGPLSPLHGFWKKRPGSRNASSPAPAPAPALAGRRMLSAAGGPAAGLSSSDDAAMPALVDGPGPRRSLQAIKGFEGRYYRGTEILQRFNTSAAEDCNSRCDNVTECTYWAWCPTSETEGCLLVEATNGTTKTVPPSTCTLSWTPSPNITTFLVMFGPGVTFFGGKWVPADAQLVTANVSLGLPFGTVSCLEYKGPGQWVDSGSPVYGAAGTSYDPDPPYDQDLVDTVCSGEADAGRDAFFEALATGEGGGAMAAARAAALGQLPDCGSTQEATDLFYAAAVASFQAPVLAGNATIINTWVAQDAWAEDAWEEDAWEPLSLQLYSQAFVNAASAAGIPACITIATTAANGTLIHSTTIHTLK